MEPEVIIGPPGTGKTESLLTIVEQSLSGGTPPDRIAFISFTRKATYEAVERACLKFKLSPKQFPYFRTIHSFCFRALGLRHTEVLEGELLQEFARWAKIRITGRWSEDGLIVGHAEGDQILFLDNLSRVKGKTLREIYLQQETNIQWSEVDRVVRALRIFKHERGLLDYTDMLEQFLNIGNVPPIKILICDEAQDQSLLQWRVVFKVARNVQQFVIAGDDDQSLYDWSGGDSTPLLNFKDYRILNQSHRVPKNLQELPLSIIGRVKNRIPKEWNPKPEMGILQRFNSFGSCDLSQSEVLILSRNLYLLDQIEPDLRQMGIIYERNGKLSVKQSILNAIVGWESLKKGDTITLDIAKDIYSYLSTGKSVRKGFKKLSEFPSECLITFTSLQERGGLLVDVNLPWHIALERLPVADKRYILTARKRGEKFKPRVKISSIHGAKGGQSESVILLKEMATRTHEEMHKNPDNEAKVWYVATTRTKKFLSIVESQTNKSFPYL